MDTRQNVVEAEAPAVEPAPFVVSAPRRPVVIHVAPTATMGGVPVPATVVWGVPERPRQANAPVKLRGGRLPGGAVGIPVPGEEPPRRKVRRERPKRSFAARVLWPFPDLWWDAVEPAVVTYEALTEVLGRRVAQVVVASGVVTLLPAWFVGGIWGVVLSVALGAVGTGLLILGQPEVAARINAKMDEWSARGGKR